MKKPKNIVLAIAILTFVVFAILIISKKETSYQQVIKNDNSATQPESPTKPNTTANTPSTPEPVSSVKYYSLTDVAKHKTSSDCWTAVSGSVYNVTSWISKHPGGSQAIIYMCGIDASEAFIDQHSGERRPAKELATFKIGLLK